MNKYIFFIVILGIISCSATNKITVASEKPSHCNFLGTVSAWQCSTGKVGSSDLLSESLRSLKNDAMKLNGNTIKCCETPKEETVFVGYDSETGEMNCMGISEYIAEVYSCK